MNQKKLDKKKDKMSGEFAREIMQVMGSYSGKLTRDTNVEKETNDYIASVLDMASQKEELDMQDFRTALKKAKDIFDFIIGGIDKSIELSEDSFVRKALGKNVDEFRIKELHNTLLGNITYEKKYK